MGLEARACEQSGISNSGGYRLLTCKASGRHGGPRCPIGAPHQPYLIIYPAPGATGSLPRPLRAALVRKEGSRGACRPGNIAR